MHAMVKNRQKASDSNWMPKVAHWRVAILAKTAILAKLAKIHQRCSKTNNKFLKGAPSLVTNLVKNLPWVSLSMLKLDS